MTEHPLPYDLDRFFATEMPADDSKTVAEHVETCTDCRRYLDSLADAQRALLRRLPPDRFATRIVTLQQQPARVRQFWLLGLSAGAVAAALLIATLHGSAIFDRTEPVTPPVPGASATVRWMGHDVLVRVHVRRQDESSLLAFDTPPRPGDRLRFEIALPPGAPRAYVGVFGVSEGKVEPMLPVRADGMATEVGAPALLTGSIALDDASAGDQLLVVVRSTAYALAEVASELQAALTSGQISSVPGVVYHQRVDGGLSDQ